MKTLKLFHSDSYIREFNAQVLEVLEYPEQRWGVILDQTAFYPESGGQPFDTGTLNDIPVIAVYQEENVVIHILPERLHDTKVTGRIDWNRRFDHMQQHSGEHILSGACLKVLQAANIGFHLGNESAQIDLPLNELSPEQAQQVEYAANEIVFANRPIHCSLVPKDELSGFKLRKDVTKVYETIRIVTVEDFDCCPCGGTHTAFTGEVGLIKIRAWERIKTGIRLDFVCGNRALTDYEQKNRIASQLSSELSVPVDQILPAFTKQTAHLKQLTKELSNAKKTINQQLANTLFAQAESINGIKMICFSDSSLADLNQLAAALTANERTVSLLGTSNKDHTRHQIHFSCSPDIGLNMAAELKSSLQSVGGKGGGNARTAQGGFVGQARLPKLLEQAKTNMLAALSVKA